MEYFKNYELVYQNRKGEQKSERMLNTVGLSKDQNQIKKQIFSLEYLDMKQMRPNGKHDKYQDRQKKRLKLLTSKNQSNPKMSNSNEGLNKQSVRNKQKDIIGHNEQVYRSGCQQSYKNMLLSQYCHPKNVDKAENQEIDVVKAQNENQKCSLRSASDMVWNRKTNDKKVKVDSQNSNRQQNINKQYEFCLKKKKKQLEIDYQPKFQLKIQNIIQNGGVISDRYVQQQTFWMKRKPSVQLQIKKSNLKDESIYAEEQTCSEQFRNQFNRKNYIIKQLQIQEEQSKLVQLQQTLAKNIDDQKQKQKQYRKYREKDLKTKFQKLESTKKASQRYFRMSGELMSFRIQDEDEEQIDLLDYINQNE